MTFPVVLGGDFIRKMTDEELEQFSRQNKPYKFEKEPDGSLVVNEPAGSFGSEENTEIIRQLSNWNKESRLGRCYDSNGGFYLPDGSLRSPDAAWISNERYESLPESDRKGYFRICPNFIIELKSKTDSLKNLKEKMKMWMQNGCVLGWLIDPDKEIVYIYHGENETEHHGFDNPISGEPVLPKFELVLLHLRM